jgi:hypothetical protein
MRLQRTLFNTLFTLTLSLSLAALGCTKKPAADNTTSDPNSTTTSNPSTTTDNNTDTQAAKEREEREKAREKEEARKPPVVLPSGTAITVSLGSALGSKLSQADQTFTGTIAKDVMVGDAVAIPQGAAVSGTVTDAKPLGKFAGGAELSLRLDSIKVHGSEKPVQVAVRTFSAKGKGKRTAVLAGGGAALGGIIGGLAGGGKGAAIGLLAGGGAGGGGAALTGNKEIVLPAEAAVSFELSQPFEVSGK